MMGVDVANNANTSISALATANTLNGTELVPLTQNQSGTYVTVKTTVSNLITAIGNIVGSPIIVSLNSATLGYTDTGITAEFLGNTNNYIQSITQNNSAGTAASADVIVANNQATATSHYGDFGINSSGFTGTGSLNQAGYVYLYSQSSDIAIGTVGSNGIHFVVNNGATDALTITGAGNLTVPSGNVTLTSGNLTATAGTITAANLTTAGTVTTGSLAVSGTVSGTGFSTYLASPPAIGGTSAAAGKFTTITATSTISPSTTSGIVGTTLADNANAGSVGEYQSASTAAAGITTAVQANATSISLTAGDWDVQGTVTYTPAGTMTYAYSGVSTTSATLPAGNTGSYTATAGGTVLLAVPSPVVRLNLSATTTVYLVAGAAFTLTCTAAGFIRARRIR
jgi:hypothetical protein